MNDYSFTCKLFDVIVPPSDDKPKMALAESKFTMARLMSPDGIRLRPRLQNNKRVPLNQSQEYSLG